MKEKYLKFIRDFSSLSIKKICEEKKLDRSSILRGRSSEEKTKILYDTIMEELQKIIPKEEKNEKINNNSNNPGGRINNTTNSKTRKKTRKGLHQIPDDMQQDTRRPL